MDPLDISYVEMHGTGTQAGDMEEMTSITNVFAPLHKGRSAKQPLHVGAVKSNVGHGEAAAGATALLKVLLMLQKGIIPRHIGIKNQLNPKLPGELESRNLRIPYEQTEWIPHAGKKRMAMVNSFSAAGGNTAVLLEEPPHRLATVNNSDDGTSHVVALSAKSKKSLKGNVENLIGHLDDNPDVSLRDLSYTTTARRYHHNHRIVVQASTVGHLRQQLESRLTRVESLKPIPQTGPPSVAFCFTGQGAAHPSMSSQLYRDSDVFRSELKQLDDIAQRQGFPSILGAIDGSFPCDHVHSPSITQLALVCLEIALVKYWAGLGIKPDVVIGHSLGEYAAFVAAGILSSSDAIFMAGSRALLLEEKCVARSHQMMAVEASIAEIEGIAAENDLKYEVACINGPTKTVLAGTIDEITALALPLNQSGHRCIVLDVAYAFHSAATDPILESFLDASKSALYQAPKVPVISPLLGKVVFDDKSIDAQYMQRATRETVNFVGGLQKAWDMGIVDKDTVWVEIGPHPTCLNFIKACVPVSTTTVLVPSMHRNQDDWTTVSRSLGDLHCSGLQVNWGAFHQPFESQLRLLDLPTYSWNDKNYWIQYNGDWALTKGNTFYDEEKRAQQTSVVEKPSGGFMTSLVHDIISEWTQGTSGAVVMQSDLMQPDFLSAAWGHRMNNCGVVTSVSCSLCYLRPSVLITVIVYPRRYCIHTMRISSPKDCP